MIELLALSCIVQWWWKPARLDIGPRAQMLRIGGSIASVVPGAILLPWYQATDPELVGGHGPALPDTVGILFILLIAISLLIAIISIIETLRGVVHKGEKLWPDRCVAIGVALALAIVVSNSYLWRNAAQ